MTSEVNRIKSADPDRKGTVATYLPYRNYLHLSQEEARELMQNILGGGMPSEEIASTLDFFRRKGETLAELVGFATAIRELSEPVHLDQSTGPVVDTCGTGGDGANTFNISTAAAFVVAGAGVRVAKHGNRRISSQCGSADVLEQLGIPVDLSSQQIVSCIENVGIGFLFAPAVHPALKHVAEARRLLQGRTVFNLLGPLTNPVRARVQLIGAFSVRAAEMLAQAAARLGIERAFVVHGADGLDEITTTTYTTVFQVAESTVQKARWVPADFGVAIAMPEDLTGGDAELNASIIRSVLEQAEGPHRDIVLSNAAAALLIAEPANTLSNARQVAIESLDSGAAVRKLDDLVAYTRELTDESI